MYERLDYCPVCRNTEFTNFMICQDYTVSQESFAIVQCNQCRFKFTNPRPTERNIGRYYQSNAYVSHSNTKQGIVNQAYHLVRKFTLMKKMRLIASFVLKDKTVLDVGCGTGMFLEVCKNNGWQVAGTEPDSEARAKASQRLGQSVKENFLTEFEGQVFEVITLWHVLEHIHQLEETVIKLKKQLSPNGALVIAVPNCESQDAKVFKEKWAAYDVPRHLYHFSPQTLQMLFKKFGLSVTKIIPMEWDAYYVSLLSTKYQQGRFNYLDGLKKGYKSNQWAKANEDNYSSLIYVLKK